MSVCRVTLRRAACSGEQYAGVQPRVLTRMLLDLDLPLALVLEGGYGPSHGQAIAAIFTTLRGREKKDGDPGRPRPGTVRLAEKLQKLINY